MALIEIKNPQIVNEILAYEDQKHQKENHYTVGDKSSVQQWRAS